MRQVRLVTIDKAILASKGGTGRAICGSVAPVVDEDGIVLGAVLVFHELVSGRPGFHPLDVRQEALRKVEDRLGSPQGIINLCSWCKRVPDPSGEWYDLATFIAERSPIQFNGGLCPECMDRCFPCDTQQP